jgi:DNA-binding transcriptional MerR regulator
MESRPPLRQAAEDSHDSGATGSSSVRKRIMEGSIPDKHYFRIGEVGKLLNVQPYVVRYWESEFKSVRPVRTRSDQRLYRKKDVEELMLIRKLLYEENFTIHGARKQLRKLRSEEPPAPSSTAVAQGSLLAEIEKGLLQIKEMINRPGGP